MRRPKHFKILSKADGLEPWLARLTKGTLAVDTETTGLDWWVDRVGAVCLAAGTTAIFACGEALPNVVRWLADEVKQRRSLVFQNAKFDLHMLQSTFGLYVGYPVHDTWIESFLLDNRGVNGSHHLKDLAAAFVDPAAHDPQDDLLQAIKQAGGQHLGDWLLAPTALAGKYGGLDPWYTLELHRQFLPRIKSWAQPEGVPSLLSLYQTERWLTLALRDMERHGIAVNAAFFEQWRGELEVKLKKTERKLIKLAGNEINWNSPDELGALLYGKLKQTPHHYTNGGKPSTDEVALLSLTHPIGRVLHEYRKDRKQFTSYASSLPRFIREDGAIHPNFRQTGARTGRLSASDPNMQQQTRESGVRRGFIPRKGRVLRFADYSQVEMRFAAHLANEPVLIKGFNRDPDFDTHRATAQMMYGITEPSAQQRKFGKIINFATLFGAGENRVHDQLLDMIDAQEATVGCHEFGYKLQPGETPHRALAQLIRARYFKMLPGMLKVTRDTAKRAEARGFTMNAFGRHRYLEDERWYSAFNSEVQGSAADMAKRGLVNIYRELQLGEGSIALMLQIHDEAVYESDGDPAVDRQVLELLSDTTSFRVPILADMSGSATSWQDKEKVRL